MEKALERAKIIVEALPYIQRFRGKLMVVKLGGRIFENPELLSDCARDILLMKTVGMEPVVVHGGGPQLDRMLDRLGVEIKKVGGLRVTDDKTMEVVEMVLAGQLNREMVMRINLVGGRAVGLSGKDTMMIIARPAEDGRLGAVGDVAQVDTRLILELVRSGVIPVIAPIGVDEQGKIYNINADAAAAAVAAELSAEKLLLLTDVEGVKDSSGNFISSLHAGEANRMIKEGAISGGMIPKVNCCLEALRSGVIKAHIIDGRVSHSLLLEILTDKGFGTEIYL
jgi:acetylglutamate kinase